MSADRSSRCESGGCLQTRRVDVGGVEYVQVRDSELDGVLLVTVAAWEAHEAGLRAEGRIALARELVAAEDDADADVLGTAYYMALTITENAEEPTDQS